MREPGYMARGNCLESIARWCKRHRLEAYATLRRRLVAVGARR
jgi:hypothetical protein